MVVISPTIGIDKAASKKAEEMTEWNSSEVGGVKNLALDRLFFPLTKQNQGNEQKFKSLSFSSLSQQRLESSNGLW